MGVNIHQYWQGVAKQRAALPVGQTEFYLVSIPSKDYPNHKPGVVIPVTREVAAVRLFEGTHQLATEEQVSGYQAELQARTAELSQAELNRKQQFALPKELNDLVAAVLAGHSTHNPPQEPITAGSEARRKRGE